MTQLKLPRGRVPMDEGKFMTYVHNVAEMNGVDFSVAEKFVLSRSATAQMTMGIKPTSKPATGNVSTPEPKIVIPSAPPKTDEEIIKECEQRFDTLHTIARGACMGSLRAVIISGAGGTGKSYSIESICDFYKEKDSTFKFEMVTGGMVTPINLYKLLWRNREPNNVIVLDDSDAVWEDQNSIALLKAALDTSINRKLSWLAESKTLKDEGIDNMFVYRGACIFLTNVDFQAIADSNNKRAPHMQALLTRSMYMDMKLRDTRELSIWIKHVILDKTHMLVQDGLTADQEQEIVKFMMANASKFRNLSLRTALKLSSLRKMNPKGWQGMAAEIEFR